MTYSPDRPPEPHPDYAEYVLADTEPNILVDLAVLGVVERTPIDCMCWWVDDQKKLWKQIGQVAVNIDTGVIELWPADGPYMYPSDHGRLRDAGLKAFMDPPSLDTHWSRVVRETPQGPVGFWETMIAVQADAKSLPVRIIRAAHGFAQRQEIAFSRRYVKTADGQNTVA
jgi:hypothetical protein